MNIQFRWEGSWQTDLKETGREGVDWIHLAQSKGNSGGHLYSR
jgi:hypothetical protein